MMHAADREEPEPVDAVDEALRRAAEESADDDDDSLIIEQAPAVMRIARLRLLSRRDAEPVTFDGDSEHDVCPAGAS